MADETNLAAQDEFMAGFDGVAEEATAPEGTEAEPVETPDAAETTPEAEQGAEEEANEQEAEPEKDEENREGDAPAEDTLQIKYNGELMDIPLSEARILAQKGMNYDHVAEELRMLRESDELRLWDEIAAEQGVTRQEAVQQIRARRQETEINALVEGGTPEEVARELIELRARKAQERATQAAEERKRTENAPWEALVRTFPETREPNFEMPKEVLEAIHNGASPIEAYAAYDRQRLQAEIENARKEIETAKRNKKNAEKAAGSLRAQANELAEDAFLAGFNS